MGLYPSRFVADVTRGSPIVGFTHRLRSAVRPDRSSRRRRSRSNMFRRAILSLVVATLIAPPGILGGQVQRMAIPAGAFYLAAGAAQAVETFCLDLTRASPKSGSEYREILTAPEHAQVIIGDQTVSLQDALSQGLVTIEGQDLQLPVSELLDELQDPLVFRRVAADLSPDERRDLSELVTGWGQLGKEDRAKAAEQLGKCR